MENRGAGVHGNPAGAGEAREFSIYEARSDCKILIWTPSSREDLLKDSGEKNSLRAPGRRILDVQAATLMEATSFSVLSEPTLVLNKFWQPIRVCTVRRAITLVFKDLARILFADGVSVFRREAGQATLQEALESRNAGSFSLHDFKSWADLKVPQGEPYIQAVSFRIRVPEVIVLRFCDKYLRPRVIFSRRNLFRRDRYTCQYCGRKRPTEELSIDHIVPRSMGGRSEWTNCVVACLECNAKKGNRTLAAAGMKVLRPPREPPPQAAFTLHLGRRKASWEHFVSEAYWNVELEA